MRPTRIVQGAGVGQDLVRFAKDKVLKLAHTREALNLSYLKKVLFVNGTIIVMTAAEAYNKVVLVSFATGGVPEILLLNTEGLYTPYSYTDDILLPTFTGLYAIGLHPTFNGTCHTAEKFTATWTSGWITDEFDNTNFTNLINYQPFELELLVRDTFVYGRFEDAPEPALMISRDTSAYGFTFVDSQARQMGLFVYMPALYADLWNLLNGFEWWIYSPTSGEIFPSSWWIPNICYAEYANGILVPGYYYGTLGGIDNSSVWGSGELYNSTLQGMAGQTTTTYVGQMPTAWGMAWREPGAVTNSPGNPSTQVVVSFNGMLDCRKSDARLPYGYAETLVSMTEQSSNKTYPFNEIFFYLSPSPFTDFGNPTQLIQGLTYHRDCGTLMHGRKWTFSLIPTFLPMTPAGSTEASMDLHVGTGGSGGEGGGVHPPTGWYGDYNVSFWNTWDDRPELLEGDYPQDYIGIVISSGSRANLYLYTGAIYRLYETFNYHSHSYSTDGRFVAIFEGTGQIEHVEVFDLNHREVPGDNTSRFIPQTPVRSSDLVNTAAATQGIMIPFRRNDATTPPRQLPYTMDDVPFSSLVDEPDRADYFTHLGRAIYNKLEVSGYGIRKIVCRDGIHAIAYTDEDPCLEGNITHIVCAVGPTVEGPTGHYTITVGGQIFEGTWAQVSTSLPFTLWSAPEWPFEVALCTWRIDDFGRIRAVPIDNVTASETGGISEEPYVQLVRPEGFGLLPTVSVEYYDPPKQCEPGTYTYLAETHTDGCGKTKDYDGTYSVEELIIYGPFEVLVGSQYTGEGGWGVGTYTMSAGTINAETGVVTSVSGGCGMGTVTYTNECGSVSMDVRFPDGEWVEIDTTYGDSCFLNFFDEEAEFGCSFYNVCSGPAVSIDTGQYKYEDHWNYLQWGGDTRRYCNPTCNCDSHTDPPYTGSCPDGAGTPNIGNMYCVQYTVTYEWQCST